MRHHHPSARMPSTSPRRSRGERGAGLVEYALLIALIAVVAFSAVSFFGGSAGAGFGHSTRCIQAAYDGSLGNSCPENP